MVVELDKTPIDYFIEFAVIGESPTGETLASWQGRVLLGEWRDGAVCETMDPADWFPDKWQRNAMENLEAARVCVEQCTVTMDCLAYAIFTNQRMGIWGGEKAETRRGARRRIARRLRNALE